MKKVVVLLCLAVLIMGCASLTATRATSMNRENLSRLDVGMSRSRAIAIMGRSPVTVQCRDAVTKRTKEVVIANPYRTEILQVADKQLEVLLYAVDINDDGTVNEAGLIPLVFEKSKLVGWGKDFLVDMKNRPVPTVEPAQTLIPMQEPIIIETKTPEPKPASEQTPASERAPAPEQ